MAKSAVDTAFDAFNAGRTAEVVAICEQLLAADADHAPALMLMGLLAEKDKRFEDAARLLEHSVGIEINPWSLIALSGCLWRLRRLDDALKYAGQAVAGFPGFAEAHLALATALHSLRRYDAALLRTREAEKLMPGSHLVEARLGCIYSQLGDYEEAMRHFAAAERLLPSFVHCRLIDYRRELWEKIRPAADTAPAAAMSLPLPDPVVTTFCDARYLRKYGASFINSFAQNAARDKRLHLHILDPDADIQGFVDGLTVNHALGGRVAVTTEASPPTLATDDNRRKTFYSCARLFHINRLLDRYRTTIACFDIDTVFEAPLDGMLTALREGYDIGLIEREPPDSPWLDIVANIIVANPTAMARRYFAAVGNFVGHFSARGEWFWHLDQIALHCVLKMMERYDRRPAVGRIAQDDAAIWHIGHAYDFKLEDSRFRRYQQT